MAVGAIMIGIDIFVVVILTLDTSMSMRGRNLAQNQWKNFSDMNIRALWSFKEDEEHDISNKVQNAELSSCSILSCCIKMNMLDCFQYFNIISKITKTKTESLKKTWKKKKKLKTNRKF